MASKYTKAFSQNLISLMRENNLTQCELSRELGIPQQTISRYLTGQREITLEYLCKFADYFGEDIDVLIGRREF
ncbi:MAG: helix-turn-helix domain-containing protein [Clostridia bacterium]|nr:helix-turn-helix domain-containing protein [Clostridia bacterium]